jgi:hypothetical protein
MDSDSGIAIATASGNAYQKLYILPRIPRIFPHINRNMNISWYDDLYPTYRLYKPDTPVSTPSSLSSLSSVPTEYPDQDNVSLLHVPHVPSYDPTSMTASPLLIPDNMHGALWELLMTLLVNPNINAAPTQGTNDGSPPSTSGINPPSPSNSPPQNTDNGTRLLTDDIYGIAGRRRKYSTDQYPRRRVEYWVCHFNDEDRTWTSAAYLHSLNDWQVEELIDRYNTGRRGITNGKRFIVWRNWITEVLPEPPEQHSLGPRPQNHPDNVVDFTSWLNAM